MDSNLPEGFRDGIFCKTVLRLTFWELLKLLFGFKLEVTTLSATEFSPGRTISVSTETCVLAPKWLCQDEKSQPHSNA